MPANLWTASSGNSSKDDRVRGYEIGKYLQVEEEDLDAVKLKSRRMIDIDLFVPVDELDPLYMGDNHYLMPDSEPTPRNSAAANS